MATLADLLIEIGVNAKEVAKGTREVEGTLKKSWKGITVAAAAGGAAIGAALMAGIDQVIEQSSVTSKLAAQLGGDTATAKSAGEAAGDIYAKGVVDSLDTAAVAVKSALQNALVPPDASSTAIADVGSKIANLSTIMEEDAGKVSSAVSQMIRTGLVDSAEEGFDVLQKGVEMGVNKSEDLLDTFNEYGTQFRKIGVDGPEALGLMSQALKAGARDSDTVADALKEFSIRAVDGSKTSMDAYARLGLSGEAMGDQIAKGGQSAQDGLQTVLDKLRAIKDPVERGQVAVGLFGTKAEDLGDALYALNPKTATDGLKDLSGAAQKAGDTLEQSAGAKLESFKRKAKGALVDQLAKAVPYIEKTFGWLQKNSSWVTPLATTLGLLAAAIGIVVVAQMAWNAVMLLNPIGLVIAGLALLFAALVVIEKKTGIFSKMWEGLWYNLKIIGAWLAGSFADFFVYLGIKIAQFAIGAWNLVKAYFGFWRGLLNKVKGWAGSAVDWMRNKFNTFVSYIKALPGRIQNSLTNMWTALKTGFRSALNWIIGKWNSISFSIPSFTILGSTFGGGTIGVKHIPQLAAGGVVQASNGGTLVNVGEGGEDEVVAPLSSLPDLAGSQNAPQVVVQIVPGGETEFRRWINRSIRVKGALASGS